MNKSSKIISTSEFYKRFSSSTSRTKSDRKEISNKHFKSNLPNEILIKIFNHLNFIDLLKCSLVSKQWNEIASLKTYWIKWAKIYKFEIEFKNLLNNTGLSHPLGFKKLYEKKLNLAEYKLNQKVQKKLNKFTQLPDLSILKNDIGCMIWTLEFHDKKDKCLCSFTTTEQNNFESSFSVVWSHLPDINSNDYPEIEKIKFFVNVPIYIDLKTGQLTNQKSKFSSENINKRTQIKEMNFKFKIFKELNPIYQDTLVEFYQFDEFLFAFWKTPNQNKQFAFISAHIILDNNFLKKIFPSENEKSTATSKKDKFSDLELDPEYGLHDFRIYFCIRNQTRTTFLSESSIVYKAKIKKFNEANFVNLNVFDCDMVKKVGPCLKMLPKFTWKSLINPKNNIDLFAIVDLCIFDSNSRLFVSKR
ncbi:F-box only [Brachionus plicatilis]|uniref:F-box only n=1 Tax=Brachionus plicatilis TaxID=10195 RepID=A0A3M7QK14_BRAPC|nr:F-box only [Brachionus plicatilis]